MGNKTTNSKGKQTELKILLILTQLGYSVSIPWGDKDRYDQIWDINGKLIKVQIKTCRAIDEEESGIVFNCYTVSNGKKHTYSKEEIDFFATVWKDKIYLIPIEECSQQKNLRFFSKSKYTNLKQINWAKDYELQEVLKRFI